MKTNSGLGTIHNTSENKTNDNNPLRSNRHINGEYDEDEDEDDKVSPNGVMSRGDTNSGTSTPLYYLNCNQCGFIGVNLYNKTHICYFCIDDFDGRKPPLDLTKEITNVRRDPSRWYPDDHVIYTHQTNRCTTALIYYQDKYYLAQFEKSLAEEIISHAVTYKVKTHTKIRNNFVTGPDKIQWKFVGTADEFVKYLLRCCNIQRSYCPYNIRFIMDFLLHCPIINNVYNLEEDFYKNIKRNTDCKQH